MPKITCPSCTTSYDLPDGAIGAEGRKVKCATCGTKWLAKPQTVPVVDPVLDSVSTGFVDSGENETAHETTSNKTSDPIDAEFEETKTASALPQTPDVSLQMPATVQEMPRARPINPLMRSKSERPRKPGYNRYEAKEMRRQRRERILRPMAFAAALLVIGALAIFREPVVRLAPDLASLYEQVGLDVNLRGFDISNVRSERVIESSGPVLIVTGEIHNIKNVIAQAPVLRFGLKTNTNEEIYTWKHELTVPSIVPGGTARFQSRLPSPPPLGRNLSVRFTDS